MAIYHCPYCGWVGTQPDSAQYDSLDEFQAALDRFAEEQTCHPGCPSEDEEQAGE